MQISEYRILQCPCCYVKSSLLAVLLTYMSGNVHSRTCPLIFSTFQISNEMLIPEI